MVLKISFHRDNLKMSIIIIIFPILHVYNHLLWLNSNITCYICMILIISPAFVSGQALIQIESLKRSLKIFREKIKRYFIIFHCQGQNHMKHDSLVHTCIA